MSLFLKKILIGFSLIFRLGSEEEETEVNLSGEKLERANYLAEMCIEHWEEYGCLPSVCIAQAVLESSLGDICYPNNYWGLYGGYRSYDTLEDGVYAYMGLINDYYSHATYILDYEEQIEQIYYGGYCTSGYEYVTNVIWIIESYNLDYYDQLLFEKLEREKLIDLFSNTFNSFMNTIFDFLRDNSELIELLNLIL